MSRVSNRLRSVTSATELRNVLVDLGASVQSRWTRTQVFFYLPSAWRPAAEEYFRGERLVMPGYTESQLATVELLDLDEALDAMDLRAAGTREGYERFLPPSLDELTADPPKGEWDVIGNILKAIRQEAIEVANTVPKRYTLTSGRCVGPMGDRYIYVVRSSSAPDPFMPGLLRLNGKQYQAWVGRQGEGTKEFELVLDAFLGHEIPRAQFEFDPTFLLRAQFAKLAGQRDDYDPVRSPAARLFEHPSRVDRALQSLRSSHALNEDQVRGVATALAAPLSYVWGPPGTGKTTSLGVLVRELVDAGKRVLVLSPYNTAVDQALMAAHGRGPWQAEQLVRFGRISDEVRELGIDLDSLLERRARESGLLNKVRQLHASVMARVGIHHLPPPSNVRKCLEGLGQVVIECGTVARGKEIQAAVRGIRREFRAPEDVIIGGARVVATTTALSFISPMVYGRPFDHVIVDEASVVRTSDAVLVASMAGAPLTFFGDPRQLPAIVADKGEHTDRWLKRTPFDLAGIHNPSHATGICVMLRTQHRMAPPIRALVSDTFYAGVLEDGDSRPEQGRVVVLDSSDTPATVTTRVIRMSPSKHNTVHRAIVASMLAEIRRRDSRASVLVLSPFRAQKMAYEQEQATSRYRTNKVAFATVHSSQGDESDIVIIDFVLAPGGGRTRFLDERKTPEFANLLNVAMSRAKRELILLAHVEELERQLTGALLEKVVKRAGGEHAAIKLPAALERHRREVWSRLWPRRER